MTKTTGFRRLLCSLTVGLALVAVMAAPALAQGVGGAQGGTDERHEGIGIGVKGGWLFSTLSAEGVEFDNRTGYQFGVFFGGNRPGLVGVMAEVNYGKKGAKDPDVDETVDITYVGVPVMLRVNAGSKSLSGASGYFLVGPEFQWLLDRELSTGESLEDLTKGFELGMVFGGGVEITRFIIELKYYLGLQSIEEDLSDIQDVKNRSWLILLGFRFN
jgi:hypothetical protein